MTSSLVGEESLVRMCPMCGAEMAFDTPPPSHTVPCEQCGHLVWFRRRAVEGIVVLDVISARSMATGQMEQAIQSLVEGPERPCVVLNLSEIKFASSSFIAGLISLHKKVRAAQGKLILCEIRPVIREVLHGARLDRMFVITDDEESALAQCAEAAG